MKLGITHCVSKPRNKVNARPSAANGAKIWAYDCPETAMAMISLSCERRWNVNVTAKAAAKGNANCNMGIIANPTNFAASNGDIKLSFESGLIAAPKAMTITNTTAVSANCRSISMSMYL